MIELVDFNEIYGNSIATAAESAKKTRRSKATAAPKKAAAETEAPTTEAPAATDEATPAE